MKFLFGSSIVIYGIYVFLGAKEATGAGVLLAVYLGISFFSGDIRIKKREVYVPDWENAERDQLDGLG